MFWEYLLGQRTDRWNDSNVHCCFVSPGGSFYWHDWISRKPPSSVDRFRYNAPIGLLLDLDEGALSIYQNGQRLMTLKDGLSGEYCWHPRLLIVLSRSSVDRLQKSNEASLGGAGRKEWPL